MDLKLAGKTVVITGASKGIGLATARVFAREGCNLIVIARDKAALEIAAETIRQEFPVRVDVLAADLASDEGIERVSAAISELDILVNNAGAIPGGDLLNVNMTQWRQAWDLKVFGYIALTRQLYSRLQSRAGVVINVIGAAGEWLLPDYIIGSSGNAALMAFTQSLGKQATKTSVRVVGINPGPVATERWHKLIGDIAASNPEKALEMQNALPFGRAAQPEEIADAVAFLASPLSAYTNATVVTIDGGRP